MPYACQQKWLRCKIHAQAELGACQRCIIRHHTMQVIALRNELQRVAELMQARHAGVRDGSSMHLQSGILTPPQFLLFRIRALLFTELATYSMYYPASELFPNVCWTFRDCHHTLSPLFRHI